MFVKDVVNFNVITSSSLPIISLAILRNILIMKGVNYVRKLAHGNSDEYVYKFIKRMVLTLPIVKYVIIYYFLSSYVVTQSCYDQSLNEIINKYVW